MLHHLTVENYALIERLDMTLSPHLNIITGETGAGKSILLGALGLVLGERADIATLKESGRGCVVEATFDIGAYGLEGFFEANDLDYECETILRRVITPAGKSRSYINDLPVQLSVLKELGSRLIDIHSQHHSLRVADEGFRMAIVDAMADNGALREEYGVCYEALRHSRRELTELRERVEAARRDRDYIEHQYNQLAALKLRPGELEELESEQLMLDNVERIGEALGGGGQLLDEEENGVLARLKQVENLFQRCGDVYTPAAEIAERVRAALLELKDISALLSDERERVDYNPERAAIVVERIDAIYTLMRKHGVQSVEELISLEREYGERLGVIVEGDSRLAELTAEVESRRREADAVAARLTESRTRAGGQLAREVVAMLSRLGMEHSSFVCAVTPVELSATGGDGVEFRFSSNPKFQPQPLERVASGGEISRVMLCLKALVAGKTEMPTVVFDEIDTGISGRIADVTGQIIAELSAGRQVVNITHLPQVASKGDTHFKVYKDGESGHTRLRLLTHEERIEEVAAMLSGTDVTPAALEQARQLIK
ncbi:MAG: DNA repair protein RecN [Tidjanibacter sp.]|nr:DNA repair protein RecN [Tidjanibacter sp.]